MTDRTYIQDVHGKFDGSLPNPGNQTPAGHATATVFATTPIGPTALCDSCGQVFTLAAGEADRIPHGKWILECDSCASPEHGHLTPINRCTADGCVNDATDEDDGLCDLCGDTATDVVDWGIGYFHICDSCEQAADEPATCDRCHDAPVADDSDLCAHCHDEKTSAETGYDIYGRKTYAGEWGDVPCDTCGRTLGYGLPDDPFICDTCNA